MILIAYVKGALFRHLKAHFHPFNRPKGSNCIAFHQRITFTTQFSISNATNHYGSTDIRVVSSAFLRIIVQRRRAIRITGRLHHQRMANIVNGASCIAVTRARGPVLRIPQNCATRGRSNTQGERTSSGIAIFEYRIAIFIQTMCLCTRRYTGRPSARFKVRHIGAPATCVPAESGPAAETLANDAFERKTEIFGEKSVNHGIDSGIAISEPEENGKECVINTVIAKGTYEINREKGTPTQDETTDDNCQCFCGFCLHAETLDLCLYITFAHFFAASRGGRAFIVQSIAATSQPTTYT